jgi:alpha/beta superfamily hydrolase
MARRIETQAIPVSNGRLEALLEEPHHVQAHTAVLLCHPHPLYGGTMHNKVVYRMARGLRHAGAVVLRFNFRGVEGADEDAAIALQWLRARYPSLPYALAGFSFGAGVVTRIGCALAGAAWLLATGFPTRHGHPGHLDACPIRKVFIQSTRDQFGPRPEMEALFARLQEPKRLIWIEAADHFFAGALDQLEQQVMTVP